MHYFLRYICLILALCITSDILSNEQETQNIIRYKSESGMFTVDIPSHFEHIKNKKEKVKHITFLPIFHEGKFSSEISVTVWNMKLSYAQGFLANIVIISQDCDTTLDLSWYQKQYQHELQHNATLPIHYISTNKVTSGKRNYVTFRTEVRFDTITLHQVHSIFLTEKRLYSIIITMNPAVEKAFPTIYEDILKNISPM